MLHVKRAYLRLVSLVERRYREGESGEKDMSEIEGERERREGEREREREKEGNRRREKEG